MSRYPADFFAQAATFLNDWEAQWGAYTPHPALQVAPEKLAQAWQTYTARLTGNYPFFHPRYAGQMLKPPHPVAVLGYLGAMLINPNNHALDGGPPTSEMEKEVVRDLAQMFRLPKETLGHLTSSGTIANLEALWVARQLHPDRAIAFSSESHYTHRRMCEVLGLQTIEIPANGAGQMDVNALETALKTGRIGTVVMTAGTTGYGAVDPIHEALLLRERYGVRIHVDAAYGGFFAVLAWANDPLVPIAPFQAIGACDSVVVDPHKHGLQPYGCGAVLFRDPSVGTFYQHDSPYTYFTSADLHLGEISLECSRAGAAAGALWFTLQCIPLNREGLGEVLCGGLRAARTWADLMQKRDNLTLLLPPELDILTYFPTAERASEVDRKSHQLMMTAMETPEEPLFLSTLQAPVARLRAAQRDLLADQPQARVLRSVLMKPEHEMQVTQLHERVNHFVEMLA